MTTSFVKWLGVIEPDTPLLGAKLEDGKVVEGFGDNVQWVLATAADWFCNDPGCWSPITEDEYDREKEQYETRN